MHCNGLNDFEKVGFHISCTLDVAIVGAGLQLSRLVKGIQEAPQTQSRSLPQGGTKGSVRRGKATAAFFEKGA
ncbi:hypothetical protein [Pseudomonas cichorii]|uniref:hypothetical protein n=1 Tax=Pseudomonas cichorii TaxID=36746 RepID=UPI0019103B0C|nr:hypothetical protein [Pseudomonas cichorii]